MLWIKSVPLFALFQEPKITIEKIEIVHLDLALTYIQ